MRKLSLLLSAWVLLVLAPGTVVAVAFGTDSSTPVSGRMYLVWIVGYLLQLAAFMWISRLAPGNLILPWIVASLLPWVVDWGTAFAIWVAIPCAVVAVLVALLIYLSASRKQGLDTGGIPARGVVLAVIEPKVFNVVVNDAYLKRTLRLRIERADGAPTYEAEYHGTFMFGEIPGVGSTLSLLVDPSDPQHFEVARDTSGTSSAQPSVQVITVPRSQAPAGFQLPPQAGAPGADVSDKLARLVAMHRSGDLTDDEFAEAKTELLGGYR